jgi:hypothetical protein
MQGKEFRGLAEAVTCTYGDDPWFFLRELAQNGRDAGARNIRVAAARSPQGEETLTFADDGRGMTLAHARRFLFRLYASDKGGDQAAAGRYGIGFWTILRFQPQEIHLQSRHGKTSWAVTLDAELTIRSSPALLNAPGTVITLKRPALFASADEFSARVQDGLRCYCRYLRRNDRRGRMLPLWFAGKNLTEPMALPGPLSLSFHSGPVEGAVGIGEKPMVRLYARGLPVWQGAALSQMSQLQADADVRSEFAPGLAPVFLLNGNHLDVTFSRNLALENKALAVLRKKAEAALNHLLESSLERTFPRKWHRRVADRLLAAGARLRRPGWLWLPLVLIVMLPLELLVISRCFPGRAAAVASWFRPGASVVSYRGATVSVPAAAAGVPFSYRPGKQAWFKLFSADVYEMRSGFVRGADRRRLPAPPAPPCPETDMMHMSLLAGEGETFLPLAPGQAVHPGSLRLNGRSLTMVFATPQEETIAVIPAGGGILEYSSCPGERSHGLTPAELARLTSLPAGLSLPVDLESALRSALSAPAALKAAKALSMVRERLAYDATPATARLYAGLEQKQDWLAAVLAIGRGDCDILNGFQVLLLRKMGVPSRLVIGMTGDRGRVRPLLHAWSEYFDQGWKVADATPPAEAGAATVAASPPAGAQGGAPAPTEEVPATNDLSLLLSRSATFLIPLLLAAAAGLFLLCKKKDRGQAPPAPPEQMIKPLIQLIQHAFLEPAAWGADNPLWRHRLLPAVGGDAVSIHQVRRLLREKKLFITANRNPLALAMAASGITVLDLSEPPFTPMGNLLAGAVDTDRLCRLRPEAPATVGGGLLAATNGLLRSGWRKQPGCLLAPGLSGVDLLKVSLPAPLRHAPFYFPRRFIAVNPHAAAFARLSTLHDQNPALALIRFLRLLRAEQMLDDPAAAMMLRKTARRSLRLDHG